MFGGTAIAELRPSRKVSDNAGEDDIVELRQELAETLADSQALIQTIDVLDRSTTADDAAHAALETVRRAFGWAYGSYWKIDPTDNALHCVVESGDAGEEFRKITLAATFREGVGLAGRAWKNRDLYFTPDLGEMTDCVRAPVAQRAGVKSGICFPILVDGKVVGTMDFFATEALRLSEGRLAALRNVGARVSQALARINRSEIQAENLADTKALVTTIDILAKATNADEAAQAALDTVRRAFGWAYGSYWKIDPVDDALHFAVESGDAGEEFRAVTLAATFREGVGLAGRAWKTRDLYFTKDLGEMTDCVRAPVAQRAGVKSGICLPIIVNEQVVGTMDFFATETLEPSDGRLTALRNVGLQVSQAVARINRIEAQRLAAATMRELLEKIAGHAESLAGASEELTATASQMNSGAERTSAQAGIVSSSSSSVAGDIAILAGAVEELSASIREIASNTSSANLIGSEAAKEASATNAIVARLGESSAEIGQVIKVITSIAQQTNLLALNATIEAARAGDAGRGFAVVANEVKDLARETAMATEQVSAKIEAIQNETSAAVSAIARIGMTIQRVTEIQTTIAAAVEQQAATTGEITRSVNGAAAGARDITDNINGVAGAAATTAKGAAETQHAASELAVLASQLHALVAQFNS